MLPLSPDGAAPTHAEVHAAFEGILAGTLTREAAAAWARARRDAPPARGQFGALPPGSFLGFAFWALLAGDITAGLWTSAGPPYYLRDADVAAWAAGLRNEAAPRVTPGRLQPLAAHEARSAPIATATLAVAADTLSARLGLQSLRGLDEVLGSGAGRPLAVAPLGLASVLPSVFGRVLHVGTSRPLAPFLLHPHYRA